MSDLGVLLFVIGVVAIIVLTLEEHKQDPQAISVTRTAAAATPAQTGPIVAPPAFEPRIWTICQVPPERPVLMERSA